MSESEKQDLFKESLDIVINYLARLHPPTEAEAEFGNAMIQHIRWIREGTIKIAELDAILRVRAAALASEDEGERG